MIKPSIAWTKKIAIQGILGFKAIKKALQFTYKDLNLGLQEPKV